MRKIKPCLWFIGLVCASALSFASSIDMTLAATQLKTHINNLTGVSCDVTAQRCLAVGFVLKEDSIHHVVYSTQDGGYTWSKPITLYRSFKIPMDNWDNRIMKVSCDDSGMLCHVAGSQRTHTQEYIQAFTTYNGGLTWSTHRFLRKQNSFSHVIGLSCGTWGEHCIILGKDEEARGESFVYTTDDMGQTWSKPHILPQSKNKTEYDTADDISCSDSGLVCTIVGGMNGYQKGSYVVKPIHYTTTNGGTTWSEPHVLNQENSATTAEPLVVDAFTHIRCNASGSTCIALRHLEVPEGSILLTVMDVYSTSNSGLSWQKVGTLDSLYGLLYEPIHAFDCTNDLKTCVAIHSPGGVENAQPYVYVTHDAGVNWAHHELGLPEDGSAFMDMFCDDNGTICQIVGMAF